MASLNHFSAFKYVPLTTAMDVSEFERDVSKQYEIMRNMSRTLPQSHHAQFARGRGTATMYGARGPSFPDEDALYTGFAMVLSMLFRIVDTMKETDDTLQSLIEDQEDEEAILHATGELFAAKAIYINLVASIEPLEDSRLQGTAEGVDAKEFFSLVHACKDIPQIRQGSGNSYPYGSSIGTLNIGKISGGGTVVGKLVPILGNTFQSYPSASPAVSATPPVVPKLLP